MSHAINKLRVSYLTKGPSLMKASRRNGLNYIRLFSCARSLADDVISSGNSTPKNKLDRFTSTNSQNACITYNTIDQTPAFLHFPATLVQNLTRQVREARMLKDRDQVENIAPSTANTQLLWKLYPDRPIENTLIQVAREIGARNALIYISDAQEPAFYNRWCGSTPTRDILKHAIHATSQRTDEESCLSIRLEDSTVSIQLPKLQERIQPLVAELDSLEPQLAELEKIKQMCDLKATRSASILVWAGLGLLCAQWGTMFHLTYVAYSWDTTEPISYFLLSGTGILAYMFYSITRREYSYEAAEDLHISRTQHKLYTRAGLDMAHLVLLRARRDALVSLVKSTTNEYNQ